MNLLDATETARLAMVAARRVYADKPSGAGHREVRRCEDAWVEARREEEKYGEL